MKTETIKRTWEPTDGPNEGPGMSRIHYVANTGERCYRSATKHAHKTGISVYRAFGFGWGYDPETGRPTGKTYHRSEF